MISSQPHNLSPDGKVRHEKRGGNAGRSPAIVEVTCFEKIVTATQLNPVSAPKRLASPSGGRLPGFVVLDLQTTGVSTDRHDIIQIAASRLNADGSVEAQFSTYVRPRNRVPRDITTLTGISDADVANAPTVPEALRSLTRFVGKTAANGAEEPMIVTLKSNMQFIYAAFARYALPFRRVRFTDSSWFYLEFWNACYARYPYVPDLTDIVDLTGMEIWTHMADGLDTLFEIDAWLGFDGSCRPAHRRDGAAIRVRLFATMMQCVIQCLLTTVGAEKLRVKGCEHVFIATA